MLFDKHSRLQTGALVHVDGLNDEHSYRQAMPMFGVEIRARVIRTNTDKSEAAISCLKLDDAAFAVLNAIREGQPLQMADQA